MNRKDAIIVNTFAPNVSAPESMKKTSTGLEEDRVRSTIRGGFDTPLSRTDRTARQKLSKETQDSNNPTNTYRTLHPTTKQGTFSLEHLERSPGYTTH